MLSDECEPVSVWTNPPKGAKLKPRVLLTLDRSRGQRQAVVLQKKRRRGWVLDFLGKLDPCLPGTEACAASHHWAREIAALGHDVRLIPPAYVKPYVKRGAYRLGHAGAPR